MQKREDAIHKYDDLPKHIQKKVELRKSIVEKKLQLYGEDEKDEEEFT